jgi:hypothetical protein
MGCVFFFFLKKTVYIKNEKQNTEELSESLSFCNITDFVKAAKLFQNKISRNQKKYAPQLSWSTCKKIFSPIDLKIAEKKGEYWFLAPEKLVSRKMQNKKKLVEKFFFRLKVSIFNSFVIQRVVWHGESESKVGFN